MRKYNIYKKLFAFMLLPCLLFSNANLLYASEETASEQTEIQIDTTEDSVSESSTQSLQLSATVAAAKASYYVEVPSEVAFGAISTTKDTSYAYEIKINADNLSDKESITVSSEENFPMTATKTRSSFLCYNNFETQTFTKSDSAVGTLTIYKEDAAAAAKGSYSGSLRFQITYSNTNTDNSQNSGTSTSVKIDKKVTGASVTGLSSYASAHKEGNYTFTVQPAKSAEHQNGIASIAALISAGGQVGNTLYYDFSLSCDTGTEVREISDTEDSVLEIYLPLTTTDVGSVTAYRYHDGTTSLMQLLNERPTTNFIDNTYYYDLTEGYVCFYSSKFSVFAVHKMAGSTSTTTNSTSTSILDVDEETNFTASVSLRKSTDFSSTSMCNALFYEQADMVVNGDTTKLTLYVIDPIPSYTSEGTPLSNVTFTYNSTTYSASIDNTNKVAKAYPAASGFISTSGNYNSSLITVTLPTAAIKASADKALTCSAYINAVMKSTQTFYVVLTDFAKGTSATATSVTKTTTATTTSGNKLNKADGTYQVSVTSIKENTNDASMMADYMYPQADLVISGSSLKLTIYIQHIVAGIEAGGPKYIKYDNVEAARVENAVTLNGILYDSFTFSLTDTIENPMLITMFINAMNLEVKARLVFDLNGMTLKSFQDDASTTTTVSSSTSGGNNSPKSSSSTKAEKKEEETTLEEETVALASPTLTEPVTDVLSDAVTTTTPQTNGYLLVTDACLQSICYLLATILILAGVVLTIIWKNKKWSNLMKKKLCKRISYLLCFTLLTMTFFGFTANAKTLPCQSATATGSYSHPQTGVIEDSGGENSQALGQSMVTNVVDSNALLESLDSGDYLVSIRFHLMNNLSDIKLYTQIPGASSWNSVSYEKTATGNDTGDFRFQVSDTSVIIKAECKVDAMGRYVIFYITLSNFTDGNAGGFVQKEIVEESATEETIEATTEASETISTEKVESTPVVSDPLQDVEGLSIGGSSSKAPSTTTDTALPPQELNVSGQVWFMLFVILFCTNVLAGLAVWGIKNLISYLKEKSITEETESTGIEEMPVEDDLFDLNFIDETDWEATDDEEEV